MVRYLLRRLIFFIPTLLGVTFITFLLVKSIPGDPTMSLVGERANPETIEVIRKELGVEKPFIYQYLGYIRLLCKGEMGRSFYTNREVVKDIKEKLPHTLCLAIAAIIFASFMGIGFGVVMAVTRGSFWDRFFSCFAIAGVSLPVFWIGLILMLIFSLTFRLLPPSGMGGGNLIFLILPASTLGLNSAAYISRITRASLLEVLAQPFVATARSKGLSENVVIFKHSLKNAMIPIITLIGIDFGSYLNGAVLTETIFGWDGIGLYALEGIIKRDYPVVMGSVLVGSVVFILVNMVVDFSYTFFNPQIRVNGMGSKGK
ncbi:MAG: ABC transporter permease [Thermodesulfobacteriota bacterium]|jgi:ABC-type dipeptide/oligopeptide/nickel transport system permease component|nr:MAG: ABC transporter permease [Thermodesulfobacteriota bacterium]